MRFHPGDIIAHRQNPTEYFLITGLHSFRTHFRIFPIYARAGTFPPETQVYGIEYVHNRFILISSALRTAEELNAA